MSKQQQQHRNGSSSRFSSRSLAVLLLACLTRSAIAELAVSVPQLSMPHGVNTPLPAEASAVCCVIQDGTYSAAMMDVACSSDLVFYPSNTDEVAAHVRTQVKAAEAAGTAVKIRASHR